MKSFIKKLFKKKLRGSYTLESTIIIPLFLFMLFQLVLLAFFMHDTVCAKNISYRYLIDYSMDSPNNLALQATYNTEELLIDNAAFSSYLNKNAFSISSELYTIPITFCNYQNTESIRKYIVVKKSKKENL